MSICVVLISLATPGWADPVRLAQLLRLDQVVAIMREEGLIFGAGLGRDMLRPGDGPAWQARVSRLYDVPRMSALVHKDFTASFPAELSNDAEAFFGADLGQRITQGELAARRAFLNPDVEEAARRAVEDRPESPRIAALNAFIQINGLVDYNVSGGLTANYKFFQGLAQGGVLQMSEDEILAETWATEEQLRADTQTWLLAFLNLSYKDLTLAEIQAYSAFSETDTGRAVNRAIFAGFDRMYTELSLALGLAIADLVRAQEL